MPHHIRAAVPADAPHIATIKIESWREAYAHILNADTLARLNLPQEAQKQLTRIQSNESILVSTNKANTPVAYAHWIDLKNPNPPLSAQVERRPGGDVKNSLIQTDWPHPNMLAALYVHPYNYRQGHGTALIVKCAQLAISQGHQGMMIGVFQANTRAHNLYTKLGATLFRSGHFEVDGTDYPDYLLRFDNLLTLAKMNHFDENS